MGWPGAPWHASCSPPVQTRGPASRALANLETAQIHKTLLSLGAAVALGALPVAARAQHGGHDHGHATTGGGHAAHAGHRDGRGGALGAHASRRFPADERPTSGLRVLERFTATPR